MMAAALLEHLLRRKENYITIASNILEDAIMLANKYESAKLRCTGTLIDV